MDINKEELVNSADAELLDSQIDQITDSFIEEHFLDNDEAEQLEMLVAKSMKLGELYERKKWQEKAPPEGFVLVRKELPEEIAEAMAKERVPEPREENDPVWLEIAKDAYKSQIMSKKWELWRDYKAMIEAQEQSHD